MTFVNVFEKVLRNGFLFIINTDIYIDIDGNLTSYLL